MQELTPVKSLHHPFGEQLSDKLEEGNQQEHFPKDVWLEIFKKLDMEIEAKAQLSCTSKGLRSLIKLSGESPVVLGRITYLMNELYFAKFAFFAPIKFDKEGPSYGDVIVLKSYTFTQSEPGPDEALKKSEVLKIWYEDLIGKKKDAQFVNQVKMSLAMQCLSLQNQWADEKIKFVCRHFGYQIEKKIPKRKGVTWHCKPDLPKLEITMNPQFSPYDPSSPIPANQLYNLNLLFESTVNCVMHTSVHI